MKATKRKSGAAKRDLGEEILDGLRELKAGRQGRITTVPEETVSVRELRKNLSVYLDRLKTGIAFRVTDRGRAVALMIPIPQDSAAIERLIASGRATAPKHDLLSLPRPKGKPSRKVSKALLLDREDRF